MTPEEEEGLIKSLGLDELVEHKLRILMPDPEKLTPEHLNVCKTGGRPYVLEVEVNERAQFVGAVSVPTLMDILGGGVGGPIAYAFVEDDRLESELAEWHKRWYMSFIPGVPLRLPLGIRLEPRGVSAVAGILHGHFELVPRDEAVEKTMGRFLKLIEDGGIITMPSKEYMVPTGILEALKLGRQQHAKG